MAKPGIEPEYIGTNCECVFPVKLLCQIPAGFSAKTIIQCELPDGVFRSLLERLPLSPDGRFVVALLVALGFSEEIVVCRLLQNRVAHLLLVRFGNNQILIRLGKIAQKR